MAFKKGNIPFWKGKKMTDETRRKMSIAKLGIPSPRKGFRGEGTPMWGKHHSEETKQKISLSHLGKPVWNKGLIIGKNRKGSETKRRLFAEGKIRTRKGQHNSEEHNRKLRESRLRGFKEGTIKSWNKGKKCPEFSLDKNPRWLGGKSFEPYGLEFNRELKNKIRQRDNQVCMNCGIHREKLNKSLAVHHINYDKGCSIEQNLISLCNSCHIMANSNRIYWTNLFQEKLSKLYGYKYSNGEIVLLVDGENGN